MLIIKCKVGSSGTSIQKLLLSVPLAPILSVHDDGNIIESSSMSLQYYIIVQRRYWLLLEICRLLVSVAMMVGPAATINYILPSVDEFFDLFIEMYGRIPINSITLIKALELGAELYTPLNQLTGIMTIQSPSSSVLCNSIHHTNHYTKDPRLSVQLFLVLTPDWKCGWPVLVGEERGQVHLYHPVSSLKLNLILH